MADELVEKAKIAEQAERYEDMAKVKNICSFRVLTVWRSSSCKGMVGR